MGKRHRLCLSTSRYHGIGLVNGYRTSINSVLVDVALEIFIEAAIFVYCMGNLLEERRVLVMKKVTLRWTTDRWTISREAIMLGLLDVVVVGKVLLGMWLSAKRMM